MTPKEILDKIPDLTDVVKLNIINKTSIDSNTGSLSHGYARIYYKYRLEFLHRLVASTELNLDIDNNECLALHKRECPNTNCWNPEHLYVGTHSENTLDSIALGNFVYTGKFKTHCPYGHEYTMANTKWKIRARGKFRVCRECNRLRKNRTGKVRMPSGVYYKSRKD